MRRVGTGIRALAFAAGVLTLLGLLCATRELHIRTGSALSSPAYVMTIVAILGLILLGLCLVWYEQKVRHHDSTLEQSTRDAADRGLHDGLDTGEKRLAALTAGSTDVTLVLDEQLTITYASASSQRVLGRTPVSMRRIPVREILEDASGIRCEKALPAMTEGTQVHLELTVLHADGRPIPVEATITSHLQEQVISGYVVNLRDLSDISHFTAELAHQALHDPLTDLPNRRMFAGLVAQAAREDDVHAQVAPGQRAGVPLGEGPDALAVDQDLLVGGAHLAVQPTQDRVVLEQVGQRGVVGEVVHRHDLDVGAGVQHGPREVAADAPEAIDANSNGHVRQPSL